VAAVSDSVPGTGLPASKLVLGTMTFGDRVGRSEAMAMVDAAYDAGVTWFDTANKYAGGESERLLGEALRGRRDQVVVATKVRHPVVAGDPDAGLRPDAILRAVDASLARLGMDHIDVLYFHQPDWKVDVEPALETVAGLVEAGKVGVLAASNHPAWLLAEMRATSVRRGWAAPTIHQFMYNLTARGADGEYARFSAHAGLHNVVYNPLAGGLLTGRYRGPEQRPDQGRFTQQLYRDRYWHRATFAAVDALVTLATEAGLTPVELAYRWLLGRELVDAIIVGASGLAQLEQNLAAAAGPPLDRDLRTQCDVIWAELRGPVPPYWR
jgi:aryl-alcohol dehydrogenase-like predicted oxidoreductase